MRLPYRLVLQARRLFLITQLALVAYNGVSGSTGFSHSTSNPPGSNGEDCGNNYRIYYNTAPSTDGSDNYLRSNTTDDKIESADWGGEGNFETFDIDVSGETSVVVETFGNTIGVMYLIRVMSNLNGGTKWMVDLKIR